ncbi:MAG: ABC transporter permease [Acetobacteraceae bacterium]|nr:ABC transporter permease [Acetobacteraceae bacterium]
MRGFWRYLARRLAQAVVTLFLLASLIFLLFRLVPGDPVSMYVDVGMTQEARAMVLHQFGLDRPLGEQYLLYLSNLLRGNFGVSFQYGKPALQVVGERFWATVLLMAASLLIAFVLGVAGGAFLAWQRGTWLEALGTVVALVLRSAPVFWSGMILLSIFAFKLKWFPLGGIRATGLELHSQWEKFLSWDFLHHLFLPALTAGLYSLASPLLVMRTSMLDVIREDFIELARAKGLKEYQVVFRHAVRNSLLPVITVMAVMVGFAIGGVVLVETVFRWPGLGREIVMAVRARDYPVAQTCFILIGATVMLFNLLADLLYGYLDPRVVWD